ncbi:hypothetical protein B4144_1032 [Bacillus atrophaeus]|nr:hypothetical protein B4144_1032 [Bacillus atrophaeus]
MKRFLAIVTSVKCNNDSIGMKHDPHPFKRWITTQYPKYETANHFSQSSD